MLYIWVQHEKTGEFEPHMSFKKAEREDAVFEIDDLKQQDHRAKFGGKFK